ncbi:hypothetical protein KWH01_21345 [Xanthomonas campestris pv. merremiae]|nr:hypothetical protein [Xanthomonas campestris pv. merremiae]
MRWLVRVFASAIARRVAYVIVALILSAIGMNNARAADSKATAYSKCMAYAANFKPTDTNLITSAGTCIDRGSPATGQSYRCQYEVAQYYNGPVSTATCGDYPYEVDDTCSKKPPYNIPFPSVYGTPRNGSLSCFSGCRIAWFNNGDGTYAGKFDVDPGQCSDTDLDSDQECKSSVSANYYYNAALGVCEPEPPKDCPAGQVKDAKGDCIDNSCPEGMTLAQDGTCKQSENECPAGQVKSPAGGCLPGDGQCAQGEAKGKDGTCKRDADGDGKPDEGEEDDDADKKSTFSGGDNCDSPPSCSGDVILCGQARIQWRIDCNTRRNVNIQGGSCAAAPVCVGKDCKAMEYSQLLFQWRTACALEKAAGNTGNGNGNADIKAIRDVVTGTNASANIGDEGEPGGAFSDESGYGEGGMPDGKLDTTGFGYSRSCPTIPDVSVFGQTIHFDTSRFCQWMVLGGQIVLVMAALLSIRLMSQGGT